MDRPTDISDTPPYVLFVCSGNTCRSPMAEALARHMAEKMEEEGISFRSAGTSTVPGLPVSQGAYRAAVRHGLSLEGHRSTPVSRELVQGAELILTMGPSHLIRVVELGGEGKAELLGTFAGRGEEEGRDPSVMDPYGGDDAVYEATFLILEEYVGEALKRLVRKEDEE